MCGSTSPVRVSDAPPDRAWPDSVRPMAARADQWMRQPGVRRLAAAAART